MKLWCDTIINNNQQACQKLQALNMQINLYIDCVPITILEQNLKAKNNYNIKQHECVSCKKEKLVLKVYKVLQFFWKNVVGLVKDGCEKQMHRTEIKVYLSKQGRGQGKE